MPDFLTAWDGDHAGTLHYGTTSGHLSAAFFTSISKYGNNFLSVGVDGGYARSGFNPNEANMEDPTEIFDVQKVSYPLLCLGLAWYYQPTGDLHTKVGFSVRNLNRPNISYSGLGNTFLMSRYSLFARLEWRNWESLSLMPIVSRSDLSSMWRGAVLFASRWCRVWVTSTSSSHFVLLTAVSAGSCAYKARQVNRPHSDVR